MTGEWEAIIPDAFNSKKGKVLTKQKKITVKENRASENKKPQKMFLGFFICLQ